MILFDVLLNLRKNRQTGTSSCLVKQVASRRVDNMSGSLESEQVLLDSIMCMNE